MTKMMKLVGDIGGTRSRLGLSDGKALHQVSVFANDDYPDFTTVVTAYLASTNSRLSGGCLAVAGPIADDGRSATLTNRGWLIDLSALESRCAVSGLTLVNDFAAAAMGVTVDTDDDPLCMQAGTPVANAQRLVIGAGTGLGVASLIRIDGQWQVMPGEGGHIGFAPQDATQDGLCRWLRERHGRVIIEHIVSGSGLAAIHDYLHGRQLTPAEVGKSAQQGDIQALASFDLFASIYGAVAGDYALARMARGGVYLAGGVAGANLELMQRGAFLKGFNAKGVHSKLAERMPIHIVTESLLGLHGAAVLAER